MPSPSAYPDRLVLEGVPRIGFYRFLNPLCGSLHAWLEYAGDPAPYDYLMGVTGAPFRRTWNRDDGGNVDLMYFPEPHTRVLSALGYSWQEVPRGDRAAFLDAVRESLAAGRPVIAFGIVGPPEACLITGYDRGGEVMIGWSFFQGMPDLAGSVPTEANGYFAQANWYDASPTPAGLAALAIGERGARPEPREVLAASLAWVARLERTPLWETIPDHVCGLTAYEAWANGLAIDADFPAGDAQVLGLRAMVHGDQATMLEERRDAARYLRRMAEVAPEAAGALCAAADLYDATANEMSGVWRWGTDMGEEVGRGLTDRATRRAIAACVRRAGQTEGRAVEHLEEALALLEGA